MDDDPGSGSVTPVSHDVSQNAIKADLRGDAEIARLRLEAAQAEIDRLRLTDEERQAVEVFADIHSDDEPPHEFAATLRKLLERLRGER